MSRHSGLKKFADCIGLVQNRQKKEVIMIRLDYLLKKDGYLFALMLITVPLAGN
ncbi:sensor histidine kinase [Bacillus velezensis]|nr:sensor histidine kinase [Bacillus velezensis]